MKKIIFATGNEGKMNEIRMIMKDLDYEILSMKEVGIDIDIEETGTTFEENAFIKARTIAKLVDAIVLADDSGLEVDYLNKEPGVYSARYLGENTSFTEKCDYIVEKLQGVEEAKRTARFVCAIACVFPNGEEKCVIEAVEGLIAYKRAGGKGFGYDPIFYYPEFKCTFSQMSAEQKNELSHRGKALEKIKEYL